jgi:hypothetical protein
MVVAITNTQQGVITEAEFAKIAILTSNGRLVPTRALADDDRRDFEIHIRRHFRESLAVQVKTAKHLRLHGRSRVLQINFRVKAPVVSDEHLYYFLAHFDIKARGYTDPLFFIPSPFFHKHALHAVGRGTIELQFKASMEANAKGMWTPFALPQAKLGERILEILKSGLSGQPGPDPAVAELIGLPGVVWLHQPAPVSASRRSRAA